MASSFSKSVLAKGFIKKNNWFFCRISVQKPSARRYTIARTCTKKSCYVKLEDHWAQIDPGKIQSDDILSRHSFAMLTPGNSKKYIQVKVLQVEKTLYNMQFHQTHWNPTEPAAIMHALKRNLSFRTFLLVTERTSSSFFWFCSWDLNMTYLRRPFCMPLKGWPTHGLVGLSSKKTASILESIQPFGDRHWVSLMRTRQPKQSCAALALPVRDLKGLSHPVTFSSLVLFSGIKDDSDKQRSIYTRHAQPGPIQNL